ncbi:Protein UGT-54 [Aphelenchoides avenae]|nr:Protein UGT-54 [Aphelenchus avenae]
MQFQGTLADLLVEAGHEVHVVIPDRNPHVSSNGTTKAHKVIRFPLPRAIAAEEGIVWLADPFLGLNNMIFDGSAELLGKVMFLECQEILENEKLFAFLAAQHYDVALAEAWQVCAFGMFHALGIPTRLGSFAVPLATQLAGLLGIPSPPSFVPYMLTPTIAGDEMPYWERVRNFGFRVLDWHFGEQLSDQIDGMYRAKYGADFPGVNQLTANISLVFINANPFFDLPRPISHKTVYVGGIVEKKPSPLLPAIAKIFEAAHSGVVLFSFGSIADTRKMPVEMKKAFLEAFARYPDYRFIWKSRASDDVHRMLRNVQNVHVFEWIDQVSILAHPKTRAFITHCGMNSLNEAATHGVPVIAVPLFSDQLFNAATAIKRRTGVYLDVRQLTTEAIVDALDKVLNEESYRERALTVKKKIASMPFRASEVFVKWAEFAAEHGDLSELNLAGADMNTFVYHSLDVIVLVVVTVLIALDMYR